MDGHIALDAPPSLGDLCRDGAVALFIDFDGTLVDLADTPDSIRVAEGLTHSLCSLADRLKGRLALISGRAIVDLDRHLGSHALARAGSHGIDRKTSSGDRLGAPASAVPEAAHAAMAQYAALQGLALEAKSHGCALHFRRLPDAEDDAVAFVRKLAAEHDMAVKRGKGIVEIVHHGADKGAAVRAFMQVAPFEGALPVFLGDDLTDEDGFCAARELAGFGIVVGDRASSAARYRLADTTAVHEWLGL